VTRRELIVGGPRLWLLAWRFHRKTALPAFASALLAALDRAAERLHRERGK
jgi:hypothetical protein